jgi:hypothetical protein
LGELPAQAALHAHEGHAGIAANVFDFFPADTPQTIGNDAGSSQIKARQIKAGWTCGSRDAILNSGLIF